MNDKLYLFLDESGNFDFSNKGSKYYIFSCVAKERPFLISGSLEKLKYDLIEYGGYEGLTHFHAFNNNNYTRMKVYDLLQNHKKQFDVFTNIIQKNKTNPALRAPVKFYSLMLGYLIKYVISQYSLVQYKEVIIITDRVPTNRNKALFERTIKNVLNNVLPVTIYYKILHHPSMSCTGLQIADYCCYVFSRKYELNDLRYYNIIKSRIRTEFDFFQSGTTVYY